MSNEIQIMEVRVRNFRSLEKVDLALSRMTVILGPNNAGKTAFLVALHAAIGAGTRSISAEDIFVDSMESEAPEDRSVLVDVLIRPSDETGETVDSFPDGSPWIGLWGANIQQDADENDFVAIRFTYCWDSIKGEYLAKRCFLRTWSLDPDDLGGPEALGNLVHGSHLAPLSLYYLGEARDIANEIGTRGSLWTRLVADTDLATDVVDDIEEQLGSINELVLGSSKVLSHIQEHLRGIATTISCDASSVAITPVPRSLADLRRGIDVILGTHGGPPLSMGRQGMGTRSLATILLLKAYLAWKLAESGTNAIHPFSAVEEPESHLQPQSQRSIIAQLREMPGQLILTTHSPYVASYVGVESFRYFRQAGAKTSVHTIPEDALNPEDIRKLDRQVLCTHGEVLFSRGIILVEGETEEQAIPVFSEEYWGTPLDSNGLIVIGVGSCTAYLPFLRLAVAFGISWWIFSDGEAKTIREVDSQLAKVDEAESASNPNVHILPDGHDWEGYLASGEYETQLVDLVVDLQAASPQHERALRESWANEQDVPKSLAETMRAKKTLYGAMVAPAIIKHPTEKLRIPGELRDFFQKIGESLGIPREGASE